MRYAVLGDIHGNLPALEATLDSIKRQEIEKTFCLGDIVGYGAQPEACVELIRSLDIPCVMGNHDYYAVVRTAPVFFNPAAAAAILWTRTKLSARSREFLKSRPLRIDESETAFVHASPETPDQWSYLYNPDQAQFAFAHFTQRACFIGHTHIPAVFQDPPSGRALVNPGSVGQPRDGDPRACYGVYELETGKFEWNRVDYPVAEAAAAISKAGLPPGLGRRLFEGR